MERILMSQNENNNGTDYIIVNGILIQDDSASNYIDKISIAASKFNTRYKDKFITIKQGEGKILLSSHYVDKDKIGRSIYYSYLIDKQSSWKDILDYLEQDSKAINRTINRENTLKFKDKVGVSAGVSTGVRIGIGIGIGIAILASIIYLTLKNNK